MAEPKCASCVGVCTTTHGATACNWTFGVNRWSKCPDLLLQAAMYCAHCQTVPAWFATHKATMQLSATGPYQTATYCECLQTVCQLSHKVRSHTACMQLVCERLQLSTAQRRTWSCFWHILMTSIKMLQIQGTSWSTVTFLVIGVTIQNVHNFFMQHNVLVNKSMQYYNNTLYINNIYQRFSP